MRSDEVAGAGGRVVTKSTDVSQAYRSRLRAVLALAVSLRLAVLIQTALHPTLWRLQILDSDLYLRTAERIT